MRDRLGGNFLAGAKLFRVQVAVIRCVNQATFGQMVEQILRATRIDV